MPPKKSFWVWKFEIEIYHPEWGKWRTQKKIDKVEFDVNLVPWRKPKTSRKDKERLSKSNHVSYIITCEFTNG